MFEQASNSTGRNWKRWAVLVVLLFAALAGLVWVSLMTRMPLKSYAAPLPTLTTDQLQTADRLARHVRYLSETIGERNPSKAGTLQATTEYLETQLKQEGYAVVEQTYLVQGQRVSNLEVKLDGDATVSDTVVVGAHFDSAPGSPAANDNATGVAALLDLARALRGSTHRRTIRLVFFVNEEPPFFQTREMGSLVYARELHDKHVAVSAMISLETIGFYSDVPGSQKYPALLSLFYPDRGDFVGFVGDQASRNLVRRAVRRFRETTQFPSEGVAAPANWPGVGWSDHWSFWHEQYPAIMVTDTAVFRYPYYHTPLDTAAQVNFEKMARVVEGVRQVVEALATDP